MPSIGALTVVLESVRLSEARWQKRRREAVEVARPTVYEEPEEGGEERERQPPPEHHLVGTVIRSEEELSSERPVVGGFPARVVDGQVWIEEEQRKSREQLRHGRLLEVHTEIPGLEI